jgi:hypothetical protein
MGIMQLYPIHEFAKKMDVNDGGFGDLNPILCAIENGACEIDVIILEEENRVRNNLIIKKSIQLTFQNIAVYEYSKWLKGSYYWKTSWIE